MESNPPSTSPTAPNEDKQTIDEVSGTDEVSRIEPRGVAIRWAITILAGVAVYLAPIPEGVTPQSWRLLAIFLATIVGSILRPVPGGAMVLIGIAVIALTKSMPLSDAVVKATTDPKALETLRIKATLAGYADPVVWLVLAAFFISR